MSKPEISFNPHLSVDCVIFGFDGEALKVLLIKRAKSDEIPGETKSKLPGDLIHKLEDLDEAAKRILFELTGLKNIFLKQFSVFGDPNRIPKNGDRQWLENTSGMEINRVVTTAYYSLIRIDKSKIENELTHNASWHDVTQLPMLAFDHESIINKGLSSLRDQIRFEPICFELLPKKFTVRQIQTLYEVIVGQELDNRNFRKKLLKAEYVELLNEKQSGVAHKPASYYRFNKEKYNSSRKEYFNYNF
jgi:8-oxo-dGTP diphosphatase